MNQVIRNAIQDFVNTDPS